MSRIQQKKRETVFLEHFKELYFDFPEGDVEPDETPDFIVMQKDGSKIGIELTELFAVSTPEEIRYLKTEQLMFELVDLAKEVFESTLGVCIQAEITFDRNLKCTKKEKKTFSLKIADDMIRCYKDVSQQPNIGPYEFDADNLKTPFIHKIKFFSKPLRKGVWITGEGAMVRNTLPKELDFAIKKKDPKASEIKKKVMSSWLLIVEPHDKLFFDSWSEIATIKSAFDKVFVLRAIENSIIELK